jgi:hypothetical protein
MPLPIIIIAAAVLVWAGIATLVLAACRSAAAADHAAGAKPRHLHVVGGSRGRSQAVTRQHVRHGAKQNFEVAP